MAQSGTELIDMNLGALLMQLRDRSSSIEAIAARLVALAERQEGGLDQVRGLLRAAELRRELSAADHQRLIALIQGGRAVDTRIAHDETRAGPAATPDATVAAPPPPVGMVPPQYGTTLQPGHVIRQRYVLEKLLGVGGMGQVWKARDLVAERARDPNPLVAIKLLSANFESDPDGFMLLQRETRKAQELAHPNVSTVYSFDVDDDGSGRAFMSMELLEGTPLNQMIRANPKGVARAEAVPLLIGMARGLEYAHRKGLVHSDFKPANVFILENGLAKILDFGIARAAKNIGVDRPEDFADTRTLGGMTIAYASPEMIEQADSHPADDVYALGLVSYELLTGEHPFMRRMAVDARDRQMKAARIRGLRTHEWQAIARALDFDRKARWQNAGEFLRALEGRSRIARVLAVAALLATLAAVGFWYRGYRASLPAVPFAALPATVQAEFNQHLGVADGEWRLVTQGEANESLNAAMEYARAYALHPRNPAAVAGLTRVADYLIERLERVGDREERLRQLRSLQGLSDFYANYRPLTQAIEKASAGP